MKRNFELDRIFLFNNFFLYIFNYFCHFDLLLLFFLHIFYIVNFFSYFICGCLYFYFLGFFQFLIFSPLINQEADERRAAPDSRADFAQRLAAVSSHEIK
jgi:hypothetical protein